MQKALLMLDNGYYEYCRAFSGSGTIFGEFVFNTSMSGYEEILTDPSYKGQIVVFTNPLIGNYGITGNDYQSPKINSEAVVIRELSNTYSNYRAGASFADFLDEAGIIGVDSLDTRALTKNIREHGAIKGGITTEILDPEEFRNIVRNSPDISESNLYNKVINEDVVEFLGLKPDGKTLCAVDFGIKNNIIENLKKHFKNIYLVPYNKRFDEIISGLKFDGIFLSNGPGDPRIVNGIGTHLKKFAEDGIPITGICFGLQMIGKAFGLQIDKLRFGHHGGNHPVKNIFDGKVYITAQNHNYAVATDAIEKSGDWELTWVNLFDGSVEGFRHKHMPLNAVQFHPEASPGPHEAGDKVFSSFERTISGE